ncbi:MAG TPA: hypothetical protein VEG44_07395 [Candidatus Acidoferrales bacterium]|nr:hypothetical protein [Candidatus Acidoferrales bacterium]
MTKGILASSATQRGVVYKGGDDQNVYALNVTPGRKYGTTQPMMRSLLPPSSTESFTSEAWITTSVPSMRIQGQKCRHATGDAVSSRPAVA